MGAAGVGLHIFLYEKRRPINLIECLFWYGRHHIDMHTGMDICQDACLCLQLKGA